MASLRTDGLLELLRASRGGAARGTYAVCSANPFVLDAAIAEAIEDESLLLVESTSNQVNPEGGYTGTKPAGFAAAVRERARGAGLPAGRLVLGGDHLGPHPYREQPAEKAMAAGCEMVRQYALAGYAKLHLDASMRLGDDAGPAGAPPRPELVAERTAELCAAAEEAHARLPPDSPAPAYVIGTDVPPPGGETSGAAPLATTEAEAEQAVALARAAFRARSLDAAWERVVALVVQPGIDFTATRVFDYDREAAAPLRRWRAGAAGLVFEAHSTDYQTPAALRSLVADGFAILKVGPWLTFALRQAVFALEAIEREWLGGRSGLEPSGLRDALEAAMDADPRHWRGHHPAGSEGLRCLRAFGYADRVRYYWPCPGVQAALARLLANLRSFPPPPALLAQYLPKQYDAVRAGRIGAAPAELVRHAVREVTRAYARACSGRS